MSRDEAPGTAAAAAAATVTASEGAKSAGCPFKPNHGSDSRSVSKTLFDLYGQEDLSRLIDVFYNLVVDDPKLQRFFRDVRLHRMKHLQTSFMCLLFGSDSEYHGRNISSAHANLNITNDHFDAMMSHYFEALHRTIPGASPELIQRSADALESMRPLIICNRVSRLHKSQGEEEKAPNFAGAVDGEFSSAIAQEVQSLGGTEFLVKVSKTIFELARVDAHLAAFFVSHCSMENYFTNFLVSKVFGASQDQYTGRALLANHRRVRITCAVYQQFLKITSESFQRHGAGPAVVDHVMQKFTKWTEFIACDYKAQPTTTSSPSSPSSSAAPTSASRSQLH